MSHLVCDLRDFRELLFVPGDIALRSHRCIVRRPLLHLVRAHVHRLNELPLESARAAETCQPALRRADARDGVACAAQRTEARRACFLVVDAKIGIVRKKIEFISKCLDHCACKIARIR